MLLSRILIKIQSYLSFWFTKTFQKSVRSHKGSHFSVRNTTFWTHKKSLKKVFACIRNPIFMVPKVVTFRVEIINSWHQKKCSPPLRIPYSVFEILFFYHKKSLKKSVRMHKESHFQGSEICHIFIENHDLPLVSASEHLANTFGDIRENPIQRISNPETP